MIKTLFFYLIFAASCCPIHHRDAGYGSKPIMMDGIQKPILYAKLQSGEIVRYDYAAYERDSYSKNYPELAKTLRYIGSGHVYSFNGVVQTDTSFRTEYFWAKK